MKIWGVNILFCPPPKKKIYISTILFIKCNARIDLKGTVRHNKTIKFDIQTLLNIRAKCYIATLRKKKKLKFSLLLPPPPIRKIVRRPCLKRVKIDKWPDLPLWYQFPLINCCVRINHKAWPFINKRVRNLTVSGEPWDIHRSLGINRKLTKTFLG